MRDRRWRRGATHCDRGRAHDIAHGIAYDIALGQSRLHGYVAVIKHEADR